MVIISGFYERYNDAESWLNRTFPQLRSSGYEITSEATDDYNCVAWAAETQKKIWWPDINNQGDIYWPPSVPREETIDAFIKAFQTIGYKDFQSLDDSLEDGFQKIAIYALSETPKHVARQLPCGKWTSKIGPEEDIKHNDLQGLSGDKYGKVVRIMKKSIQPSEN
jgi:hypothetical protein